MLQKRLKYGDRVSLVPLNQTSLPKPQENVDTSTKTEENKFFLLKKEEENYVVHLTGHKSAKS